MKGANVSQGNEEDRETLNSWKLDNRKSCYSLIVNLPAQLATTLLAKLRPVSRENNEETTSDNLSLPCLTEFQEDGVKVPGVCPTREGLTKVLPPSLTVEEVLEYAATLVNACSRGLRANQYLINRAIKPRLKGDSSFANGEGSLVHSPFPFLSLSLRIRPELKLRMLEFSTHHLPIRLPAYRRLPFYEHSIFTGTTKYYVSRSQACDWPTDIHQFLWVTVCGLLQNETKPERWFKIFCMSDLTAPLKRYRQSDISKTYVLSNV
ncbi:hypothetical protein V1478_003085 [Vespula squamosa]|uniref:Uncharacterized protein n=1 Tax=Vespula squamosa TaxID=30214 RepID=A0ABD2BS65_VESSQ